LLLHVIDASHQERERHIEAVRTVLAEVGAEKVPAIEVFNKCDLLDEGGRARVTAVYPGALCVSALKGQGRDEVIAAIEGRLGLDTTTVVLEFKSGDERDRERISQLYRVGRIRSHVATDSTISIEADVPRRMLDQLASGAPLKGRHP